MSDDIDALLAAARGQIAAAKDTRALEQLRVSLLGKKGTVTAQLKQLGTLPPEARRAAGQRINRARDELEGLLTGRAEALSGADLERRLVGEKVDVTLPGRGQGVGGLHPVTRVIQRIERLFANQGFASVSGPEVEDDFHNFQALNIPESHPARAMQDTFYINDGDWLLRTHTSPVQIRTMQRAVQGGFRPPVRIICPGRVYRRDFDRTHSPMFHQVEGLYVAEHVSMADLKYDLLTFLSRFFERDVEVMFRPSYFPFVEPGADVHARWDEGGKKGDWLELLGCGMVHPNVFKAVGIDPKRYRGYAFGVGVERLAMLRYGVSDLREFFNNDVRFLAQFG